jgi:hypothetical protein
MLSSAITVTLANRRANGSTSGRPFTFEVSACLWQNGKAASDHSSQ